MPIRYTFKHEKDRVKVVAIDDAILAKNPLSIYDISYEEIIEIISELVYCKPYFKPQSYNRIKIYKFVNSVTVETKTFDNYRYSSEEFMALLVRKLQSLDKPKPKRKNYIYKKVKL